MRPKQVSSSQAKGYYYEKDSIFSAKGTGENSYWYGVGAGLLLLQGQIKEEDFFNVLVGNDPRNGNQIIKDGPNGQHENNIDLTFDAPKSVSIMALHAGDNRLIEAHHKAVKAAQDIIEKEYSYVRVTHDGKTEAVLQSNMIFANFIHSTSRENDPQLHTHGIIMNMVETKNGWRALKNNSIFEDQKLIRSIYQSELAKHVQDLGYNIDHGRNGEWEIAGVQKEAIAKLSKRDTAVMQYWKEHYEDLRDRYPGASNEKLMDLARIESRPDKVFLDPSELKTRWDRDYAREVIRESVLADIGKIRKIDEYRSPIEYINVSCQAIHERESTFTRQGVIDGALKLSRGQYTLSDMEKAFQEALVAGEVRRIGAHELKNGKDKTPVIREVYSSQGMIEMEYQNTKAFIDGKGQIPGFMTRQAALKALDYYNHDLDPEKRLNRGQIEAAAHLLSNNDRFSIIQGDAGTGKTTMMKSVNDILHRVDPGVVITGLGFTGKAAHELEQASGIPSNTIHSFLEKTSEKDISQGKELWVVDESSMVSSKQMHELLKRANAIEARVVFIGDAKQLQSIQAGKMFKDLQEKGLVNTVVMDKAIRQKTEHLQQALSSIKAYQEGRDMDGIEKAFAVLINTRNGVYLDSKDRQNKTFERPDPVLQFSIKDELVSRVVMDYVGQTHWQHSTIVTPTNDDRVWINHGIHTAFKENGVISGQGYTFNTRSTVSFRDEHARMFAANYELNQNVFLSGKIVGFKKGSEWKIIGRDTHLNRLFLENKEGIRAEIDLMDHGNRISIYRENQREFSTGDKVVFGKNDKKMGISNGSTGIIDKVDEKGNISVRLDGSKKDPKSVTFNINSYAYIDHGYALTLHKAQGMSYDKVYYVADTRNAEMNKSESFYVAVSRAKFDVRIYTDNVLKLTEQVKVGQEKTSTLDHTIKLDPVRSLVNTERDQHVRMSENTYDKGGHREIESRTKEIEREI